MKRVVIGICLVLLIVAGANLFLGRAQEASAPIPQPPANAAASNPLKVALLKWFPANLTTNFKVGKSRAWPLTGPTFGWPTNMASA